MPFKDRRRDLIGAWHRPTKACPPVVRFNSERRGHHHGDDRIDPHKNTHWAVAVTRSDGKSLIASAKRSVTGSASYWRGRGT